MATTDANAVPCDPEGNPLPAVQHRPAFQLSPNMVCFIGGIAVALGIMWLCTQITSNSNRRRSD